MPTKTAPVTIRLDAERLQGIDAEAKRRTVAAGGERVTRSDLIREGVDLLLSACAARGDAKR